LLQATSAHDYHVLRKGRDSKPAMKWESGETGQSKVLTYAKPLDDVKSLAAVLGALGVEKGDRVAIYVPIVTEAIVGILACTQLFSKALGLAH
jgi:propionyl-CoA synthetase